MKELQCLRLVCFSLIRDKLAFFMQGILVALTWLRLAGPVIN